MIGVLSRCGIMTLREAGAAAGGMDYTAVAMRIHRMEQRLCENAELRKLHEALAAQCEM